jgi:transposase
VLFVGDDWAEDHHDVEVQDETGRRLARARLPEGVARLHELIGPQLPEEAGPDEVAIGIETDKGPWVQALVAAGYAVYAVNPRQVARYRDRHGTSGAKSDQGDAHTLADMVRTDRHQLRVIAGDTPQAQAVKVVARAHQTLIWDRQRHALRLRAALLDFFPAALAGFDELTAPDTLRLLAKAPDPAAAARLSRAQVLAELKRAGRRGGLQDRAEAIVAALHTAAEPAAGGGRGLRGDGALADRADRGVQHSDRGHGQAGGGLFWSGPGRGDLPEPTRPRADPGGPGLR